RFRQADVLRRLERLHFRGVHEQEEHQDREDVHQRDEVQSRAATVPSVVPLHPACAIRFLHVGASPTEISGKSSACTNCEPCCAGNVRTVSITCTMTSYGVSGSSRIVAAITSGN